MSTLTEAAAVISEAEKNLRNLHAPISHAQAVEIAELLDSQRRELAHLRTGFAKDQAQIASLRVDLEQAAKVTEELVDGLSEETRKRQLAELELADTKAALLATAEKLGIECAGHLATMKARDRLRELVYEVICWNGRLSKRPAVEMFADLAAAYRETGA